MNNMTRIAQIGAMLFLYSLIFSCKENCQQIVEDCLQYEKIFNKNHDTAYLVKSLNKAPIKAEACIDAYFTRGDIFFSINYLNWAKSDYYSALMLEPNNVYGLFRIGLLFQETEKFDSSIYYFQKAINRKTKGSFIVDEPNNKGILSNNDGKYDIQSTEIIFQQGISYYYNRNLKEAMINFNHCISHNYMLEDAYKYRGAIYAETNEIKKACYDFSQSKLLGNDDVDDLINKYCK